MAEILIIYSTTDGHTHSICQRLKQTIEHADIQVTLLSIDETENIDINAFDKLVIGASIRYGKHQPKVYEYIAAHQQTLDSKPNAFFSVNLVARKAERNQPGTNPYVKRFLRQIAWNPQQVAVFAGKLDYPRYGFFDRQMIRFIMWLTRGPTDPRTVREFTDWDQVDAFGRLIREM